MTVVGRSVPRIEDAPLLRGHGAFAADIDFPRQLHLRIVRADVAHGRLAGVDTKAARALPGVVAVWDGTEVADIPPIPFRATKLKGLEPYCQPILASGRVRYVGEPVAAVFAEDPFIAEDAADLVVTDVEEIPALLDALVG
jgi:CO/xanthine dehydrogenase Mo-binding subunit